MIKFIGKRAMTAALAAMLMLTGCASRTITPVATEPLKHDPQLKTELKLNDVANQKFDEEKLNAEYGRYSFKMLAEIAANVNKNCNVMVSPASIMMALDMVAAGAKGETLKQLNELFSSDTDPLEQQAFASEMMKRINAAKKLKFVCANAIWSDSARLSGKINSEYTQYIKKTFEAEFSSVPFNAETHKTVNKWVDEKTNHMIPELFEQPFGPNTVMVLVNAIRFEAQWANGYKEDQIRKMKFKGTEGEKETFMLTGTEKGYFMSDKATGFIKYYQGEEYAFVAILPRDEKANANEFIKNFSYDDYQRFISSRTNSEVYTLMPEFKSDYGIKLNDLLKNLGVTDAFSESKADLTGIADPSAGRLFVSNVFHKTHIEVDRKGTKAAAATGITLDVKGAMPMEEKKEVICNRPYVYAIVEVSTMNPIFIGTVNNVE